MALDAEPNNTDKTASKGGYLSLYGGEVDDISFGSVSASDPIDYFAYSSAKTLKQVKVSLSPDVQGASALLRQGGVFGVVDHLSLKGSGSFSGAGIDIEVRLGYDAIADQYEKALKKGLDSLTALTSKWIAAGGEDDANLRNLNTLAKALNITTTLLETDGKNVEAKQVLASLQLMQESSLLSPEIKTYLSSMIPVLKGWDTPRYFSKNASGNYQELTSLAASNLTANWNVSSTSTQTGFLIASGHVDVTAGTPDLQKKYEGSSIGYTATVAVQSELAKAGNTISGSKDADVFSETTTVPGQKKATIYNDIIKGNGGNDKITGGGGADQIWGGAGADTFIYQKTTDSLMALFDTINDFTHDDTIDLHLIDANTNTTLNDAFKFIGTKAYSMHAGELRYAGAGGNTFIYADVNGDGKSDFAVKLVGNLVMSKTDFVL